ncbi:hypothetical protein HKD37_12G034739 [Glycine soja]|nr:hypothetical protein GmHk_12G035479 [Glycine max]
MDLERRPLKLHFIPYLAAGHVIPLCLRRPSCDSHHHSSAQSVANPALPCSSSPLNKWASLKSCLLSITLPTPPCCSGLRVPIRPFTPGATPTSLHHRRLMLKFSCLKCKK